MQALAARSSSLAQDSGLPFHSILNRIFAVNQSKEVSHAAEGFVPLTNHRDQ